MKLPLIFADFTDFHKTKGLIYPWKLQRYA